MGIVHSPQRRRQEGHSKDPSCNDLFNILLGAEDPGDTPLWSPVRPRPSRLSNANYAVCCSLQPGSGSQLTGCGLSRERTQDPAFFSLSTSTVLLTCDPFGMVARTNDTHVRRVMFLCSVCTRVGGPESQRHPGRRRNQPQKASPERSSAYDFHLLYICFTAP